MCCGIIWFYYIFNNTKTKVLKENEADIKTESNKTLLLKIISK